MRTLTLYILVAGILATGTGFADGQIEMRKHRFSRHDSQGFERLVLEFKNNSGADLPSVRVGTDGTAGEVTIQVGDAALRGSIPESEVNDRFVPRSHLLGPISVSNDSPRGGFTIRTFLKEPQARVDAFWIDSPLRLVLDAYGTGGSRNNASVRSPKRRGSRRGSGRYAGDVICFPTTASVGMQVTFQATGKRIDSIALPVEGARNGDEGSVVCYPKNTQLSASISFDHSAADGVKAVKNRRVNPNTYDDGGTPDPVQATPAARQEMPVVKATPKPGMMLPSPSAPVLGGAPANHLLNKSPITLESPKALSLSMPSPGAAPSGSSGLLSLPSPGGASKPAAPMPVLGLSLPAPGPARAPSASVAGASPLTLPSLPQPGTGALPGAATPAAPAASAPSLKLNLPPPQSAQQLLPPLSTK